MDEMETRLLGLLQGKGPSLSVQFNDHSLCYIDAKQALEKDFYSFVVWASEAEKVKAVETNRVWTIQWYPQTPVGFCMVGASSLEAALKAALEP